MSSVLTPELVAAGGAHRDVGVAAQRALLHVHVADAERAQRAAQQLEPLARLLGRAQVRLGHDLRERRAAAVEVDDARVGAVDPPARAQVDQLGGVLLEVHAVDAHVAELPAPAQGLVVLRDLVALGEVGIEVVLAVEDRPRRELRAQRGSDHQPEVDRSRVGDRQAPGQPEAHRAGARVRRLAEGELAAAEHLRGGRELHVDLEPDHGLERSCRRGRGGGGLLRHGRSSRRTRARARARARRRAAGCR